MSLNRASLPPAIFLLGPTASGKTALAVALAAGLPVEIISVDSALVYRDMVIGTARPSDAELAAVPHHLVNVIDPAEAYSAARFRRDALQLMAAITGRGRIPLLVGGTMLYFRALQQGLAPMPAADPALRQQLRARAEKQGWPALHAELAAIDPVTAARLHPNHSQRIERALEVYQLSGRPLSELQQQSVAEPLPYQTVSLALAPADRALLHARIADRFGRMLEQGLIEEVEALRRRGDLTAESTSMLAVGYRQVWQYLDGDGSRQELLQRGIAATRQLAKRQLTWLRSWPDLQWLLTDGEGRLAPPAAYAALLPEREQPALLTAMAGAPVAQVATKLLEAVLCKQGI